jgi:hypothetical protein
MLCRVNKRSSGRSNISTMTDRCSITLDIPLYLSRRVQVYSKFNHTIDTNTAKSQSHRIEHLLNWTSSVFNQVQLAKPSSNGGQATEICIEDRRAYKARILSSEGTSHRERWTSVQGSHVIF